MAEQSVSSKPGGVILKHDCAAITAGAHKSQCGKYNNVLGVKAGQQTIHTKYEFNHFLIMKVYIIYA